MEWTSCMWAPVVSSAHGSVSATAALSPHVLSCFTAPAACRSSSSIPCTSPASTVVTLAAFKHLSEKLTWVLVPTARCSLVMVWHALLGLCCFCSSYSVSHQQLCTLVQGLCLLWTFITQVSYFTAFWTPSQPPSPMCRCSPLVPPENTTQPTEFWAKTAWKGYISAAMYLWDLLLLSGTSQ